MLLQAYHLQVFSPPCHPGAASWSATAALDDDMGEVLPYLNTVLKGAIYNPAAHALTWRMDGHTIAIRPREIAVSNLPDRESAATVVQSVLDLVNLTWEQRTEITPSTEMRQRLKPTEVYRLLPGTNCKACSQTTCFTLALKVTAGQAEPEQCPPLFTDEHREKREKLLALLSVSYQ